MYLTFFFKHKPADGNSMNARTELLGNSKIDSHLAVALALVLNDINVNGKAIANFEFGTPE